MSKDKILLVDDAVSLRALLGEALAEQYDIIEGSSGEEAIDLAFKQLPQLILLSIEIPGKSGIDVCQYLKSHVRTKKIPIILLSAHSNREEIILGLKAGADDYMVKPLYLPGLVARVGAHLRTSQSYASLEPDDLRFLLELSERISALRNPTAILNLIVEKVAEVLGVCRCSIVSVNDQGRAVVKASSDFDGPQQIDLDLARYPEILRARELRRAVRIDDIQKDPLLDSLRQADHRLPPYNSIVVVPLVKKETVIGTLFLRMASRFVGGVTQRMQTLCQLIADISANALENAVLFESVQESQEYYADIAIRDGLTELYNHRHFYDRLEQEFARSRRYNLPLSLIFFDIDDFKEVNDRFGHQFGDKVLNKLGLLLRTVARESDIAARYGGEEFAVLLPNTSADGALKLARRLHSTVRNHTFNGHHAEKVTVSIGVSTFINSNMLDYKDLVEAADKELYKAKQQGKDRVCQAENGLVLEQAQQKTG